ncbi:hypothetical protein Hanom_Chr03g00182811 [Helianthus anomalus]
MMNTIPNLRSSLIKLRLKCYTRSRSTTLRSAATTTTSDAAATVNSGHRIRRRHRLPQPLCYARKLLCTISIRRRLNRFHTHRIVEKRNRSIKLIVKP